MNRKFKFFSDPGHAWLRVTLQDLAAAKMPLEMVSRYSYRDGANIYLEEDCDASLFIAHWEANQGPFTRDMVTESHNNGRSFVRNLERIGG